MKNSVSAIISRHCGPVFFGKKPAALFSLSREEGDVFLLVCRQWAEKIIAEILYCRSGRVWLFIYRPAQLSLVLQNDSTLSYLCERGYPITNNTEEIISHLKKTIAKKKSFPHEIGFFLGYPAEDVTGFIEHQGSDYKYCGLWKVYGDVGKAKEILSEYRRCERVLMTFLLKDERFSNFYSA